MCAPFKVTDLLRVFCISTVVVCLEAAALPDLHRIPLSVAYKPSGQVAGAFVTVRINESAKPLRLLLDTGVSNIVLDQHAAERVQLDLSRAVPGRISGFGGKGKRPIKAVVAHLEAAGTSIGNVPVRVVEIDRLLPDGDGLIGLDVFGDYLVEWNVPRAEIRLVGRNSQRALAANGVPFRRVGHLMFVMTTCNNRTTGYGLVDTGAAYSAVARDSARSVNGPASPEAVPLRGVLGNVGDATRLSPVRFDFAMIGGSTKLIDREPLAVNLEALSAANGLPVTAVIGYPALQNSTLTVDYRAGTIQISETK